MKRVYNLNWGFIDETYSHRFLPQLLKEALTDKNYEILQYIEAEGLDELRKMGCNFLSVNNQVSAKLSELMVTSGSISGIDMVSRVILHGKYDSIVFEPTYDIAIECLKINSRFVHGVRFSEGGSLSVSAWNKFERLAKKRSTKLVYIIPNFNNPNSVVLTKSDREKILSICRVNDIVIIEDDPYSIYNYSENKLPDNIISLDKDKTNTVYLSTFSKILYPGIRLGFLVTNQELLSKILHIQRYTITSANLISQGILLCAFKNKIITRSAKHYYDVIRGKRDLIFSEIDKNCLGEELDIAPNKGGMFIWARIKKEVNTTSLLADVTRFGVTYVPGSVYYINGDDHRHIRLCYSH